MTQKPTENATARKQRMAAERGQWASLDDVVVLLFAVAVFVAFRNVSNGGEARLLGLFRRGLSGEFASPMQAFEQGAGLLLHELAFPLVTVALLALIPVLLRGARTRLHWSERFTNPLALLADGRTLVNAGWAGIRVLIFGLLVLSVLLPTMHGIRLLPLQSGPGVWVDALGAALNGILGRFVLAMLLLAPLGVWLQRVLHLRSLRMSRQELKDEWRLDGPSPEIAAALRARGQADVFVDGFDKGHIATATHALTAPGEVMFLCLGFELGADNVMLSRLCKGDAAPWLQSTAAKTFWDPALHARLAGLRNGDRIPPACYPVLANALARQGVSEPVLPDP